RRKILSRVMNPMEWAGILWRISKRRIAGSIILWLLLWSLNNIRLEMLSKRRGRKRNKQVHHTLLSQLPPS
ncbi:hypothetical protein PMAYCL1PPCAC_26881, partial [Pristionchus mayeri]